MKTLQFILALIIGCSLLSLQAQTASNYKIANKIHLEGNEGWDYLFSDDVAGRLYVSHGNMVQVVDESNGKLIGTISGLQGVHGIAIATDLGKGYISCGRDSSVTVFDTKTLKTIAHITTTGQNPDAILYDPFSKKVFTFNGRSDNSTVIDATTDKVVTTIPLAGKPEFSVTNNKGKIFVNIEDKSKICQINSSTLKVENLWSIVPGEEPSGLAFDTETHRLFSVCDNKTMVILDSETGKVVTTQPIGERVDGAGFDPGLKCAYSSNGEGTLTVVKEEGNDSFKVLENFQTQKGARTVAVNKNTHHIYLPTSDFEPIKEGQKGRPKIIPNTFLVLDIEPIK